MPRARNPNRDKAKELWLESGKTRLLKDIAAELGIPENRIRKWKSEDKWESEKGSKTNGAKRNTSKGNAPKRKRGGQPGNKNAVGNNGGAPLGNKNAWKHGAWSKVYLDTLDKDEIEMLENMPDNEEVFLEEQIFLFSVRERRFMKAIQQYKDIQGGLAVSEVITEKTTRDFGKNSDKAAEDEALYNEMIRTKIENGERLPGNAVDVTTKTEATYSIIQTLERELTNIQARKTKCIESLAKLRLEKEQSGNSKTNEVIDDWVSAVLATSKGNEDE